MGYKRSMAKNKNTGKPRNYALDCGVYRFGKSATYHKKAIYKFVKKVAKKPAAAKKQIFVEKKVGGAKNGGTRMVRVKKLETGLLLVTGPFKLNGTPLRRVNQRFLLA